MFAHGVHCSTQAGIAGKASGATSVVLNSGYSGDGEAPNQIIMDGQGGRARLCTDHSFDQSWDSRGNAGLRACWQSGAEVRVCRGWRTRYGPTKGYRYDGCWTVVNAWQARAPDGFLRCRFHLIRLPDQPLDPEHGMPELSPRLLQELERINRARDPEHADREMQLKVYEGGRGQPQLLVEKKATAKKSQSNTAAAVAEAQAVIDGAPARKRKRTEKEWEEMPKTWDSEEATSSKGKKASTSTKKTSTSARNVSTSGKKALPTSNGEKTIVSAEKPASMLEAETPSTRGEEAPSTRGEETPSTRDEETPSTSRSGRLLKGNLKGKSSTSKARAGRFKEKAGQSSETAGEAEDMSVDKQAGDEEMDGGHARGEGSDDAPLVEAGDDGEDQEMADDTAFDDGKEVDPALDDDQADDAVFDDGKSDDDTLGEQMDKSDDELARLLQVTVKKEEDGEAQVYASVQERPRVVGRATAKVGPLRKKRKSQEAEAPSLSQGKRSKCTSSSQTSSTACSSSMSQKEAPSKHRGQSDRQACPPSDRQARPLSSWPAKTARAKRRGRSRTPPRKPVVRLTVSASPSPGP
ncbi:hypothetical protein K525DRAFT_291871 [Schizophyllum commune Loenen D]|nr:hypothetical protein K525DRAFT_291871 [Schizophyllum commune Loenen D]